MKTADLIPFILLELDDCDKYGFELTKNIEAKSNGKIVIKQPTLYTLLKKLEKSKFIVSYWQDSEIGGKRHYYKLTENGRLHVSTLPSYSTLLKTALNEEIDDVSESELAFSAPQEEKHISIMDELLNQHTEPIENILPSSEIFSENILDTSTELDLNLSNTNILKDENVSLDEQFATNNDVTKFTEKVKSNPMSIPTNEISSHKSDILNVEFSVPKNDLDIKFVDYEDFKNGKKNQYAKKVASKKLLQILATSGCILIILALCEFITTFTGHSALYYTFFISSLLVAIFYPVIYSINMDKFRLKHQNATYQPKIKLRIFIGLCLLLAIIIISIVVSITLKKTSISQIANFKNFANIYAPALMFSSYFLDLLFNHLIVAKINK